LLESLKTGMYISLENKCLPLSVVILIILLNVSLRRWLKKVSKEHEILAEFLRKQFGIGVTVC